MTGGWYACAARVLPEEPLACGPRPALRKRGVIPRSRGITPLGPSVGIYLAGPEASFTEAVCLEPLGATHVTETVSPG